MSARRAARRDARRARSRAAGWKQGRRRCWAIGLAAFALSIALVAWVVLRDESTPGSARLPGPLGGPTVAQDVNTLVGKTAPAFTLADAEGTSYAVSPGRGRPLVLVSTWESPETSVFSSSASCRSQQGLSASRRTCTS